MSAKNSASWISLPGIALFAGLSVTRAQTMAQTDIVTIICLVDSGGSCISTVAMVRACEAIQARLVATLSIVRELYP